MDMDDIQAYHITGSVVNGVITTILAFFGVRLVKQLDANTKEISDHRIEDAGKYATNSEVNESLGRVHDRIDGVGQDVSEIKTLLINMNQNRA